MRFYRAAEKKEARETMRDAYIARGVQLITEYTGGFVGGKQGLADWADLWKKPDPRTGDEIAADVIARAGLIRRQE